MLSATMDEIWGYVERVTFHNPENGFTVAKLKEPRKSEVTTIVGVIPMVQPGETLRCIGEWKFNSSHGMQFEVKECRCEAPADLAGIQKYLESGLIKGIGPVYAKRIVAKFGIDTLKMIDEEPDQLYEIEGIGKKRAERIKTCWIEQKSVRNVMIFLQQFGISPTYAQKIYKTYQEESIEKVRENPYRLAQDIIGIGFKSADTIASKMGVAKESPSRIEAGIEYILSELAGEGHTCYPENELLQQVHAILEVPLELIQEGIDHLLNEKRIVKAVFTDEEDAQPFIWLKLYSMCEQGIARELERLAISPSFLRQVDTAKALEWVQTLHKIQLAPHQKDAVAQALTDKVQVITGGPGTGKSTITKAILSITEKLSPKILLAAPTGRAAKRMAEITGKEAKTIHALLEWSFTAGGFKRNRDNPLECDLIVIDEASMIDTLLMYSLLKGIPSHARVIFVGDINQLPSVGAGNVLKDMIGSCKLPVCCLTEIFRQAKTSMIVNNAHLINQGQFPDLNGGPGSDFFFMKAEEPDDVVRSILDLVTNRLPKRYRLNAINDIQVLTPMKKGPIGTEKLNHLLQEKLNPSNTPLFQYGRRFHQGDKVMQLRNNYNKEVYNGDVGRISKIDLSEQELVVNYDGKFVIYAFSELDDLILAYAVSVHKYQGSECPCVIMPVHTSHFMMLHRNLLYTGVTRAKKLVILVGLGKALHIAVKNDEVKRRYTGLQQAIQSKHLMTQNFQVSVPG
jgi:exodeoxyribonuclease V alpha subunit